MSMALYQRNWAEQANCKDMDKSVFFPVSRQGLLHAKQVCSTCPVSADCLQYATDNNLDFGGWGGLGEADRRRLAIDSRRVGL